MEKKVLYIEVDSELHKRVKQAAAERGVTINTYVLQAVMARLLQEDNIEGVSPWDSLVNCSS